MSTKSKKKDTEASDAFCLPIGRVIHESVFTKDAYDDKAVPSYRIEIAIPVDDPALIDLENRLLEFADDKWGAGAGDDEDLILPLLPGDKLARKREKKNKDGEAYKGMTVIRANTNFNKDGQDAPGGIQVYDEDVALIEPARAGEFYPGCYAEVGVTIGAYEANDGNNALKFYLTAVQKTGDGEKLITGADRSVLFKSRSRPEGGSRRRRRKSREQE